MKNNFTSAVLNIEPNRLTVLHLHSKTLLQVRSQSIWLTHSQSNLDYVLHSGSAVIVEAGVVLIDAATECISRVYIEEIELAASFWPRSLHRFKSWFKPFEAVHEKYSLDFK